MNVERSGGRFGFVGGPEGRVLVQPFNQRPLHADVLTGVGGGAPLEIENLAPLFEEEFPKVSVGKVLGRDGLGALTRVILKLLGSGDGVFEKLEGIGREFGPGVVLRGNGDGAAARDVDLGDGGEVTAARKFQVFGAGINLIEQVLGE